MPVLAPPKHQIQTPLSVKGYWTVYSKASLNCGEPGYIQMPGQGSRFFKSNIFNYFAYNVIKCYSHVSLVRKYTLEFNKDERTKSFLPFYFSSLT